MPLSEVMVNAWSTDSENNPLDNYRQVIYSCLMRPNELQTWRARNGFSQSQLARVLGVDVMTISRWERGVSDVPPFLHLALAHLEERKEKPQPNKRRKGGI